jgi:hypothetical protein
MKIDLVIGQCYTVYDIYEGTVRIAFRSARYMGDVENNETRVKLELSDLSRTYPFVIVQLPKSAIRFWAEELNEHTYYFEPVGIVNG